MLFELFIRLLFLSTSGMSYNFKSSNFCSDRLMGNAQCQHFWLTVRVRPSLNRKVLQYDGTWVQEKPVCIGQCWHNILQVFLAICSYIYLLDPKKRHVSLEEVLRFSQIRAQLGFGEMLGNIPNSPTVRIVAFAGLTKIIAELQLIVYSVFFFNSMFSTSAYI